MAPDRPNYHNADISNSAFLQAILHSAPKGTAVWVNAFVGNPNAEGASWGGKAYSAATMPAEIDSWGRQNTYFSVAAVRRAEDGTLSRRKSHFARLLALVADDVETDDLMASPSWGIETSPGKRQIGILLDSQDPDCSNLDLVTKLVTAMAEAGFIKADKSGNNAVRYVRLPVGQNQKPRESGPFSHVLEYWEPNNRYSLEDAAGVFGIDLDTLRHATVTIAEPSMHVGEQDQRLRILTTNIIRGENLHDSINMVAASMVASGTNGGAIVNMLRGLMDASIAIKDDRWLARYNDIPRSVMTAEQKFKQAPRIIHSDIDQETGEVIERPLFTQVSKLLADIKPIQWLIENYLETDALSMVFGPPGGGKSFCTVDMASCVATGTPWHGMPVKQGAVFYIAGEGHNGLARRFAAWEKSHGIKLDDSVPLYKSNRAVMLLSEDAAQNLADEVERLVKETGHQPSMVIVDTLARNFGDGDENTQKDAGRFIEHLDAYIRRPYQCNVMTVHHSGHDMDRARGSSAFKGAMDQEVWVKGAAGRIDLKMTKMKDAEIPADKKFKISQIGLGVEDSVGMEITGAYLEVDGNPLDFVVGKRINGTDITGMDIAKAMYPRWQGRSPMSVVLGCSEKSLSRYMKTMSDSALAAKIGGKTGDWELTESAIDYLSMSGFIALHANGTD